MKDRSKLFEDVPENVYERNFQLLEDLRVVYPAYRDDQLLMRMLCDQTSFNLVTLKRCGNPGCKMPNFLSGNKNEKYCSELCVKWAQRKSKREWWNEHGSKQRRQARAKAKKGRVSG